MYDATVAHYDPEPMATALEQIAQMIRTGELVHHSGGSSSTRTVQQAFSLRSRFSLISCCVG